MLCVVVCYVAMTKKKAYLKLLPMSGMKAGQYDQLMEWWGHSGAMFFCLFFGCCFFFVCRRLRHMLALCEVIPHQQHYSRNINPGELHLSSQWNGADIVFCIYYILQISMNLTWIWMLVFYKCVALALRYFSFFSLVQILTHCDFFMSLIV